MARDNPMKKQRVRLKHFIRPMHKELDKCKVYLHDSRQTAKKKSQPAHNVQQMVLEQDEHYLKNKLNRSGKGQSPAVPNRFDAFYL